MALVAHLVSQMDQALLCCPRLFFYGHVSNRESRLVRENWSSQLLLDVMELKSAGKSLWKENQTNYKKAIFYDQAGV